MTILVTGATGNVGKNVIDQLVQRGVDVRALVRDPAKANLPAGVEMMQGDLLDVDALRNAFAGVSTLFLLNAVVPEATIAGQDLREIIVLEPGTKVTFFQATGPREGAIVNELFEDEAGELQLKFYCYLGLRDKEPCGPKEQTEQAQFDSDKGYRAALLSTLKRTRELLADGTL